MQFNFLGGPGVLRVNDAGTYRQIAAMYVADNGGGSTVWVPVYKGYVQSSVTSTMNWAQHFTTDVKIAAEIPASPTIVVDHTLLLQKYCRINWTESTNGTNYDLLVSFFNSTDPSKNQGPINLNVGRTGTSYVFGSSCGVSGDTGCYAELHYSDGSFNGTFAFTSSITL